MNHCRNRVCWLLVAMLAFVGLPFAQLPAQAQDELPTVAEIVAADSNLSFLISALRLASVDGPTDLLGAVSDPQADVTVFAPTNRAFASFDQNEINDAINDPSGLLTQLLAGHVLEAQQDAASLISAGSAITLQGDEVAVERRDGSVFVNDSMVSIADVQAANGVVHIIDAVLVPGAVAPSEPVPPLPTAGEFLRGDPTFSTFSDVLSHPTEAGVNRFQNLDDPDVPVTVFAVPNSPELSAAVDALLGSNLGCPDGYEPDAVLNGICVQFEPASLRPLACPDGSQGEPGGCYILVAFGPSGDVRCSEGVLAGDLCVVEGDPPVPTSGECAVSSTVFLDGDFCYTLIQPVDGQCPAGAIAVGDECRRPVPIRPGPLACAEDFSLVQGQCIRYVTPDRPDPRCPAGSLLVPTLNECRQPVADRAPGYICEDPLAALNGETCVRTAAFVSAVDRDLWRDVAAYHIVDTSLGRQSLEEVGTVVTRQGSPLVVEARNGDLFVNGRLVLTTDIPVSNGVVHIISALLDPTEVPTPTPTPTPPQSPEPTATPSAIATPVAIPTPTLTPSPEPTATPSAIATPVAIPTPTPTGLDYGRVPCREGYVALVNGRCWPVASNSNPTTVTPVPDATPTPRSTAVPPGAPALLTAGEWIRQNPAFSAFASTIDEASDFSFPGRDLDDPDERLTLLAVRNSAGVLEPLQDLPNQMNTCPLGFGPDSSLGGRCVRFEPASSAPACPVGAQGTVDGCYTVVDFVTEVPPTCPSNSLFIATSNVCGRPVANSFEYFCPDPASALNGSSCVWVAPFEQFEPVDAADTLAEVASLHLIDSVRTSASLLASGSVATVFGTRITIEERGGDIYVNDRRVASTDIPVANGLIHVIDGFIVPRQTTPEVPPAGDLRTIAEIAEADPQLSFLLSAMQLVEDDGGIEFIRAISDEGSTITLFAPTDRAFAAFDQDVLNEALNDPDGLLNDLIGQHLVQPSFDSTSLLADGSARTAGGGRIEITERDGNVFINDSRVTIADIEASNGVIHVIDAVLTPEPFVSPPPEPTPPPIPTPRPIATVEPSSLTAGQYIVDRPWLTGFASALLGSSPDLLTLLGDPAAEFTVFAFANDTGGLEALDAIDGVEVRCPDGSEADPLLGGACAISEPATQSGPDCVDGTRGLFGGCYITVAFGPGPAVSCPGGELAGDLCIIEGPLPVASEGQCPVSSTVFLEGDFCYSVVTRVNGACAPNTEEVDGECRRPVAIRPGPRVCMDPFGLIGARCLRYVVPTPNPSPCPEDAIKVPNKNECRLPVANGSESYSCDNLDATLRGLTCVSQTGKVIGGSGDTLTEIISYHVVEGRRSIGELVELGSVMTVQGTDLAVTERNGRIYVNDSELAPVEYLVANGSLLLVDSPLIPAIDAAPVPIPEGTRTIAEIAATDPELRFLTSALRFASSAGATDFVSLTADPNSELTLFAPTNRAFGAMDPELLNAAINDPGGLLTDLLRAHVLGTAQPSNELVVASPRTLAGQRLAIEVRGGRLFVDDSQIIVSNIAASNGIVHVIDAVLAVGEVSRPFPGNEAPLIADIVASDPDLSSLLLALRNEDAQEVIDLASDPDAELTLFAPTDAAFQALAPTALEAWVCPVGFARDSVLNDLCTRFERASQQDSTCPDGALGVRDACYIRVAFGPRAPACARGTLDRNGACLVEGAEPVVINGMSICPDPSFTPLVGSCYKLEDPIEGAPTCPRGSLVVPSGTECRQRVANRAGAYYCEDPTATLNGKTCMFTSEPLLNAGGEWLTDVLRNHVLATSESWADLVTAGSAQTLTGGDVAIEVVDGTISVNGAQLVVVDIPAANGVVHIIDAVLLPDAAPIVEPPATDATISDVVDSNPELSSLASALAAASEAGPTNFAALLQDAAGGYTLFAPTNEAFAAFDEIAFASSCPAGYLSRSAPNTGCEASTPAGQLPASCPPGAGGSVGACFVVVPFASRRPVCPSGLLLGGLCLVEGDRPVPTEGTCPVSSTVFFNDGSCYSILVRPTSFGSCVAPYLESRTDTCQLFNADPTDPVVTAAFQCPDVDGQTVTRDVRSIAGMLTITSCEYSRPFAAGGCPGTAMEIDGECRRPVALRPGLPVCAQPGHSLIDARCLAAVEPVPGPPSCPQGAFRVPGVDECRQPVPNAPVRYTCDDPVAIVDGSTCLRFIAAEVQEPAEALSELLGFHVLDTPAGTLDLLGAGTVTSLQGSDLVVQGGNGEILIDDARVIGRSIRAANGFVYLIDSVINGTQAAD